MTKLEAMLKYVSEHNDFYKERIKKYKITNPLDITQWPVLTRKEVQKNRYNMFSDGYKSKYFNQQLRRQSSSGSTGMPVNVYWDYKDWYASNMLLWRKRLQWYGIHPSDKYVMFTLNAFNVKNDGETIYYIKNPANLLSVNVSLIQNEDGYNKLVDIINEFEPKWFYIQPFILNRLIQAYKRTGKMPPKKLKYIESIGELLPSDLKKRSIDFFKVPLANMYGSEEINGIAYECPIHHMHVLSENVYLEVRNEKGIFTSGEGESIITNLNNFAMPLIRYDQGDSLVVNNKTKRCICKTSSSIIEILQGRTLDKIILKNGFELTSIVLMEFIAEANNRLSGAILEYEYTYSNSKKRLVCSIRLDEQKQDQFKKIQEILKDIFIQKCAASTFLCMDIVLMDNKKFVKKKNKILNIIN